MLPVSTVDLKINLKVCSSVRILVFSPCNFNCTIAFSISMMDLIPWSHSDTISSIESASPGCTRVLIKYKNTQKGFT